MIMDPNAIILAAIGDARYYPTTEECRAYGAWVRKGGFPARVRIAPHTDEWMRGDRYAVVLSVSRRFSMKVRFERSGRTAYLSTFAVSGLAD